MEGTKPIYQQLGRCEVLLNELLFEHGENEHLQGAAEHLRSLLWHLEQLLGEDCSCEEE